MKKVLFILTLIIISTEFTLGQGNERGFKLSLNLSNLYIDEVTDENMKAGFTGGFFYRKRFTGPISLQPELNYSLKGSEIYYNNILGSGTYRFNLSYIELPILANFHIGESLMISVGPYAANLINAKVVDVDGDGSVNDVEQLNRNDFNTIDYGLVGGVSLRHAGGTAGIRYNYGIIDVATENVFLDNGKNSVIQFYIDFEF